MSTATLRGGAIAAVALAAVLVALLLSDGGGPYEVTAEFENASQVVGGEAVVIGGIPVGTVSDVSLGDRNQALIRFEVDDEHAPLPDGTTATIRAISLAGIANRRLELSLPPRGEGGGIPDGGTIHAEQTVSAVDIDELFNTFDERTIKDTKGVVKGFARATRGVGPSANRGLRYLNPLLSTSRRVIGELTRDQRRLERLIVDTSSFSSALAERAPELSSLVRNVNVAASAIGRRRAALAAAVERLPGFLRLANTTFVNVRAAADDLEPLLLATRPVAERLGPFFSLLRTASADAVPTLRDLDAIVRRPGQRNDLVELVRATVPLSRIAVGTGRPDCGENPSQDFDEAADDDFRQGALGEATCALRNSLPVLSHFRAYTPELIGWFDDFATSGAIDANGGIGRIAGTFNVFSLAVSNGLPELLSPVDPADVYGTGGANPLVDIGNLSRCPGANERDPGDGSVPYTEGGTLNCDRTQVATGP